MLKKFALRGATLLEQTGDTGGRVRVLIADDHEEVLDDIRELLEPDFDVVGAVADGQALLAAVADFEADVIITDISMPRMDGIAAARAIIGKVPASRIILMTVHDDPALIAQGFTAGVLGYVLKSQASHDLARAIHEVLRGNRFVSPRVKSSINPPILPHSGSQ